MPIARAEVELVGVDMLSPVLNEAQGSIRAFGNQAQTSLGQFSAFHPMLTKAQGSMQAFGNQTQTALRNVAAATGPTIGQFSAMQRGIAGVGTVASGAMGDITNLGGATRAASMVMMSASRAMGKAWAGVFGPAGIALMAIAGAIGIIMKLKRSHEEAAKAAKEHAEAEKKAAQESKGWWTDYYVHMAKLRGDDTEVARLEGKREKDVITRRSTELRRALIEKAKTEKWSATKLTDEIQKVDDEEDRRLEALGSKRTEEEKIAAKKRRAELVKQLTETGEDWQKSQEARSKDLMLRLSIEKRNADEAAAKDIARIEAIEDEEDEANERWIKGEKEKEGIAEETRRAYLAALREELAKEKELAADVEAPRPGREFRARFVGLAEMGRGIQEAAASISREEGPMKEVAKNTARGVKIQEEMLVVQEGMKTAIEKQEAAKAATFGR